MRNEVTQNGRGAVAISSQHTVTLAMRWPEAETKTMLGFAVRKHNPDATALWLEGLLAFRGEQHNAGTLIPTSEGPIQKMFWADYLVRAGQEYTYEIIPVYGTPRALELRTADSVKVAIQTEDNDNEKHGVYFNRAVIASQAYVRHFGIEHPDNRPDALAWLARGLDKAILGFIGRADADNRLRLDIAAYHLTHPDIIAAIKKVGPRARVCLCWKKPDDKTQNGQAARELRKGNVEVFQRQKVRAISHDKFIVLKDQHDQPRAVLMGSANFTRGGVSLQNNVSHVIENPVLAQKYRDTFELLIEEDNEALYEQNTNWMKVGTDLELNFSPHRKNQRTDLDHFVELVRAATSNIFFATLRATDEKLIKALVEPANKNVVVRGLVDKVYEKGDGEVLLYHHAYDRTPDVAPATNSLGTADPLTKELGRRGFTPLVHHKFIIIDYGSPECAVITGSANYSNNSSNNNDENTLVVHRDQRIAQMYLGEFHRVYEHYRARWLLNSGRRHSGKLFLRDDGSWATKYYDGSDSEHFLRVLLS
jgi:phosphatidylserine/phosphatidylglycerophosphate/cardiolipin synthase-like enzyme